ncbi:MULTISPECIES: hypothetical protein [Mucilaginibacter]|uniref:Uncharacterized protein n=1 Tax=Mucilaginibacter rubeus TaxID=2027860 RepID=A0A5C1I167_9SPHI|nr:MULTISPECIES: hypothetical protein [Mucilaginibacter]QEM11028.1 hypothetical protein DEO27_013695 [Mucilaginibacter rubeus]
MTKKALLTAFSILLCLQSFAQYYDEGTRLKKLNEYQDSLAKLGKKIVNDENDMERKNANYQFIKTLVQALKINNSFLFPFDSLKSISIVNSPDNRFRILSWHVINLDGSYRFYGTVQINTGGALKMFPLEDYSPLQKNPEDSVTDSHKWYGAQYYKIMPVYGPKPYYVLLGWKGNTVKSTKKVIDVISFNNGVPEFGMPVFNGNGKTRDRVVFEYARQVSMLLRYLPEQNLIVFDHLSAPDGRSKDKPETFGPDLSYDGYKLKEGRWTYVEDLDMRNISSGESSATDTEYVDPKKQAAKDRALVPTRH